MMDTYTQPVVRKRQYRSLEEKLRIVQEALTEGASVARVARAHGVNANLVFNWCRLYRAGRLDGGETKLLPVRVAGESSTGLPAASLHEPGALPTFSSGTIHIQLQHAQVRVEGSADPVALRVLMECLQR
jgi:transposase